MGESGNSSTAFTFPNALLPRISLPISVYSGLDVSVGRMEKEEDEECSEDTAGGESKGLFGASNESCVLTEEDEDNPEGEEEDEKELSSDNWNESSCGVATEVAKEEDNAAGDSKETSVDWEELLLVSSVAGLEVSLELELVLVSFGGT
jgi:hypothetical protein